MGYGRIELPVRKGGAVTNQTTVSQDGNNVAVPEPPSATLGIPIPYIIGRERIFQPNVIWYGNLRPVIQTDSAVEKTCETRRELDPTGSTLIEREYCEETVTITKTIIGYNVSIQFGLCLGEGVVLKKIFADDTVIWEGSVGPSPTALTVAANDSAISGACTFFGGEFDQLPSSLVSGFVGAGFSPGYPGIAHIVVETLRLDQISGARLSFEVERFVNPLGLTSGQNRIGDDINIATALYDFLSSDWGGAGLDPDQIDTVTFTAAALTLAAENNAGSMVLASETRNSEVIKLLTEQAAGILYENPATGKVEFKTVRYSDYDPVTITELNERNVSNINGWERGSWVETINRLRVGFTNREKNYEDDSLFGYNFNAINDKISQNRSSFADFPIAHSEDTAKALLLRELAFYGAPLVRAVLETNRTVEDLLPGDGVQAYLPRFNFESFIGVVTKVQRFDLTNNSIIVTIEQVPRDDNNLEFGEQEQGLSEEILTDKVEPSSALIDQAPYWLARRTGVTLPEVVGEDFVIPIVLPTSANDIQASFSAVVSNKPGFVGTMVSVVTKAQYPTTASLVGAIDIYDAIGDGVLTSITIDNVQNDIWLESVLEAGVRNGQLFVLIDDEYLSAETVTDNGDGSWTLSTVHRALLDTAAQSHADNASVYVFSNTADTVGSYFSYPLGYVPNWRITSNTLTSDGDPTDSNDYFSTTVWDTSFNRIKAPYRPHAAEVTGYTRATVSEASPIFLSVGETFDVTWKTRSRESLGVVLFDDAAEEAEDQIDTTKSFHRVIIVDSGSTERDCGATADDATYNTLTATVPALTAIGAARLFVQHETLYATSIFRDYLPVVILPSPFFVTEEEDFSFGSEDGLEIFVGEF